MHWAYWYHNKVYCWHLCHLHAFHTHADCFSQLHISAFISHWQCKDVSHCGLTVWIIAPQIGSLGTLCLSRDSPCHNGHAAYALCEVKKTVWKTERLDLVSWLSSFNWGCDFIRRMFLAWWSVSQGSFAVILKNSIEFNTKCLIQHTDWALNLS